MNTGWMYYKGIYKGIEKRLLQYHIDKKQEEDAGVKKKKERKTPDFVKKLWNGNKDILQTLPDIPVTLPWQSLPGITCLTFTTTYPGLVAGTGYEHEAGIEGEFKIGFFFDHTTGLPVLPGSSVKGIIRSSFKHPDYIKEKLGENYPDEKITLLEQWIFEGKTGETPIPVYSRIIFFDALIFPGKEGFLAEDFLTPHSTLFSEPVPIKFLRIIPGSGITFGFKIPEQTSLAQDFSIDASRIRDLFKEIILDIGVGAMTGYGYGHLTFADST